MRFLAATTMILIGITLSDNPQDRPKISGSLISYQEAGSALIIYNPGQSTSAKQAIDKAGFKITEQYNLGNLFVVKWEGQITKASLDILDRSQAILSVEPNSKVQLTK